MKWTGRFTPRGQQLLSGVLAGGTLTVTRVLAGSGATGAADTALAQPRQTLTLSAAQQTGQVATLTVTLLADGAEAAYSLTELGVYAQGADGAEVLYQVYTLDTPVDIVPGSRMVLRSYLRQGASGDLAMTLALPPSGLLVEADLAPVREKVFSAAVPNTVTETLALSEVQAYLNALPRLLTKNYVLNVSGSWSGNLNLLNFYGSGSLRIAAEEGALCTVTGKIVQGNCQVPVQLWNVSVVSAAQDTGYAVSASSCCYLRLVGCPITGNGAVRGVETYGAVVTLENCPISGCTFAVTASRGSQVGVYTDNAALAAQFSGNTTGAMAFRGGFLALGGHTPDLLGGSANMKQGGIITKADGTLL